ncbi:hypothetical protein Hanom_Chr01g00041821 [Helianthus anomalus]
MSILNTCWLIIWYVLSKYLLSFGLLFLYYSSDHSCFLKCRVLTVLSYIMTGRGRVPPPGDVSSGRGRGRGRTSDSRRGRGHTSDSGGGHGSASDSGAGYSGAGRGRATDSGAGRGHASDSGSGRGRASNSGIGPERASGSSRGHGRGHTLELSPGYSRTLGRGHARSSSRVGVADPMADMQGVFRHQQGVSRHQYMEEFQHEGSGGSQHGFNMVRDHAESDDGDYHEEEDANATQLASNVAGAPHGHSQKEVISRVGMGYVFKHLKTPMLFIYVIHILSRLFQCCRFANGKVHRAIIMLFNECFDGAWSTYREVPTEHVDRMFDRFRVIH